MTPARVHIDKERGPRDLAIEKVPLDKLRLDPDNVRFRHLQKILTDKEIETVIWDEDDTKDLLRSILASGGLSEPPVVMKTQDGSFVVKEGNRRIVCCRKAREMVKRGSGDGLPKDAFNAVECQVFPDDVTEEEIAVWLARLHVAGKKEWEALNQAEHLFRLYDEHGLSYERIRELVGLGKAKIIQKVSAYQATFEFMRSHPKEADVKKFSFFEEFYKRPELRKWLDADPGNLKRFSEWVAAGKFNMTGAKDVRSLPEILKDEKAVAVFTAPKGNMSQALDILRSENPAQGSQHFAAIAQALEALRAMPRREFDEIPNSPPQVQLLKDLYQELKMVFSKLNIRA